jgi:hypothetical protein
VSVQQNQVNFGNYDFIKQSFNFSSYPIQSNYIFNSNKIWVSSNLEYQNPFSRNIPFNGTLKNFMIFSPVIPYSDIRLINSGIISDYYSGQYVTTYNNYTGVTGYDTGLLPYFTGITGSVYAATGVVQNIFGDTYTGYGQVDLTGVLYANEKVPLYGLISEPVSQYVPEYISLNTGEINTYTKSNVNFLFKIQNNENINLVYNTGIAELANENNIQAKYLNGYNLFNCANSIKNNYIVWSDGLYQYSGSFIESGDLYNLKQILSGDYIIDENGNILFNNTFDNNYNVTVDIVNPDIYTTLVIDNFDLNSTNLINTGSGIYLLNWPKKSEIFLNGQKLVSGDLKNLGVNADYGITGDVIYFINTGVFKDIKNSILSANVQYDMCDIVSNNNIISVYSGFLPGSSKAYRNGVRLDNGYDYIELGNFDTNLGTGIFDIKQNIIYNGNGGFN